jgi:protein-L-isoaspartate(D-aspartate) O-methyltransferase
VLRPLVGTLTVVDAAEIDNGLPNSPYSLIVIDGAIEALPEALTLALSAGGRIITGQVNKVMTRIVRGTKHAETVAFDPVADDNVPLLPEFAAPKRWSF